MKHIVQTVMAVLCLCVAGCSTSQLQTTWRDPNAGAIEFKRVIVLVLNSTPGERRAQEDAIVGQIKKATGVPSYTLVPDEGLGDREKVKQKIIDSGFDGAVVLRLTDSTKETSYVPGSMSYWYDGYGYVPNTYTPGYYVTDVTIRAEVSVYRVPDGKLLWVGSSTTTNPGNAREFALDVARAAAAELNKQGLLK